MNITKVRSENIILLVGGPRSGTTWLAKIFDSHPDVLYRHEPDTVLRDEGLQRAFTAADYPDFVASARRYIEQLIGLRALKSVGSLPSFPKSYFSGPVYAARKALIVGLRAVEQVYRVMGIKHQLSAPDLIDAARVTDIRLLIKSNASRMRIGLFAAALPNCKIVLILRDPFGHAASMRRGVALGKFEGDVSLDECLATDEAKKYGVTKAGFAAMPPVEQHAWHWVILNEKAINDLAEVPGATVVLYRDLCLDPVGTTDRLFNFVGLSRNEQTQAFIKLSTAAPSVDRYYQVYKESKESLNKWRTQLSEDEQNQIKKVVRSTDLAHLVPELDE